MELILLAGLVALFFATRSLKTRLDAVEAELRLLRHGLQPAPPPAAAEAAASASTSTPPATALAHAAASVESAVPPTQDEEQRAEPIGTKAEEPPPPRDGFATLFERFVAGRLLIWIGGFSLAIAGIFLVRYTVEIGLVTPRVRMIAASLFGLLLIGAGEGARARPSLAADPRIGQALVGAGILVLYATVYGALTLYGLIGLGTSSLLMALITAAALGLALRHGAPTAVMGLAGGFLTPLLVGDPDMGAVPLLAYLALLNAALFAIAARRGWGWLTVAAVVLSFVWTALLLIDPDANDALAGGLFVVAMSIAASLTWPWRDRRLAPMAPASIGLVQLALLVGRQDLGLAAWTLFGALTVGTLFLSRRRDEYRWLPPLALLLALILLAAETAMRVEPAAPLVAAAITLLFGGFAAPRALRSDPGLWTAVAAAALAAPTIILRANDPGLLAQPAWAGIMILLALGSAGLALAQRRLASDAHISPPLMIAAAATALLAGLALNDLLPTRWLPAAWLLVALGGALAARVLGDHGVRLVALAVAGPAALVAALLVPGLWSTVLASLGGEPALITGLPSPARALVVLLLPGGLMLLLMRALSKLRHEQRVALTAGGAALLLGGLYVAAKQILSLQTAADFVAAGFAERTMITQALFLAGWLCAWHGRAGAAAVLTGVAAARLIWFDLVIHNPALVDQHVGELAVINLLLPAFLGGAFWLYRARRRDAERAQLWLAPLLAALIGGVMLMVRQAFQGSLLTGAQMPRGEFYGYSLAGLLLAVALLVAGIRLPDKALRVAGLALLTATILKVFLIDAAALEGVLRILSFLGLGVALIGVGKLYGKVLNAEGRR